MLDIHKEQITACVRVPDGDGGRQQDIREFVTTTSGLLTLADWLRSYGVTVVGMESTGFTGALSSTCWRRSSSAGCSTPAICVTWRWVSTASPLGRDSRTVQPGRV